jgi:hypothetical protein
VTDKSGHNAAGFRKLQKSGFILQNPSHYDGHKAKSRHNAAGFRKLQKSGFSWLFLGLFVTFFLLFVTFFLLFVTASFYITKSVTL